ncbi:MAG: hypothetical protein ACLSFZ_08670 [Frisingicoccus sp.]
MPSGERLDGAGVYYGKYKPLVIKKARSMFLIGGETEDLIQRE